VNAILLFIKERRNIGWFIVVASLIILGLIWHHSIFEKGVQSQVKHDTREYQQAAADAQAATLAAQKRADKAELNYAIEHNALQNYLHDNPLHDANQLCINAPITIKGSLSTATGVEQRASGSSATGGVVQSVPDANTTITNDRLRLLRALGAMADQQSAVNREAQAAEASK
jgi:hypothetical protein